LSDDPMSWLSGDSGTVERACFLTSYFSLFCVIRGFRGHSPRWVFK
jgi:hypothetical protein